MLVCLKVGTTISILNWSGSRPAFAHPSILSATIPLKLVLASFSNRAVIRSFPGAPSFFIPPTALLNAFVLICTFLCCFPFLLVSSSFPFTNFFRLSCHFFPFSLAHLYFFLWYALIHIAFISFSSLLNSSSSFSFICPGMSFPLPFPLISRSSSQNLFGASATEFIISFVTFSTAL